MPLKNKDAYNAYMQKYMKEHPEYRETQSYRNYVKMYGKKIPKLPEKPLKEPDFNATEAPELDLNSDTTKQLIQAGKEIFKDPETGKPDKIITIIEQGSKYLPMALKFLEGFKSSMDNYNAGKAAPVNTGPIAPEGWSSMSPMERLKYKHTKPGWYAAGLKFDNSNEGNINANINTGYVDPTYTPPSRRPAQQVQQPEPGSLAELSRKYPDPPLISDQPPQQEQQDQQEQMHDPKLEAIVQERKNRQTKAEPVKSEVVQALESDNAKYIQMGIAYLNSMPMQDFLGKMHSLDGMTADIEKFLPLVPIHLKEMLKQTTHQDILKIFKDNCTEKYSWCKNNEHLETIGKAFDSLKEKL